MGAREKVYGEGECGVGRELRRLGGHKRVGEPCKKRVLSTDAGKAIRS